MKIYHEYDLKEAHAHTRNNYREILNGRAFSCFYCFDIIQTEELLHYGNEILIENETVLCPHCGIDTTLGLRSGFDIFDKDFIEAMGLYWFNGYAQGHNKYNDINELLYNLNERFMIIHQ